MRLRSATGHSGVTPEPEEMNVKGAADGVAIGEVGVELGGCIVDRGLGCAAELELAARLERNPADRAGIAQADRVLLVVEILPAGPLLNACEQGADAVLVPS